MSDMVKRQGIHECVVIANDASITTPSVPTVCEVKSDPTSFNALQAFACGAHWLRIVAERQERLEELSGDGGGGTEPRRVGRQPHNSAMEGTRRSQPEANPSMSIIRESGGVRVNDSNLTMAGGHVNHLAVNVSLNSQPFPEPIPQSLWLRTLGEWLLGSPTPLTAPYPPASIALPSTSGPRAVESVESCTTSPSSSSHNDSSREQLSHGIDIVPLEHLDIHAQLALAAAPVRMPHEIYVRHLFPRGHGYPCANPKPRGEPVKIGDIGLLTSDRFPTFKVLQNLYTLPESVLGGHPVPAVSITHDPNMFLEGDTITGGLDGCTVKMSDSLMRTQEGAALAITSPAELQEMEENDTLRDYLCQHVGRLFEFIAETHRIPEGSSIYIVTGTIVSASWATATHDRAMNPSYDSLVLKRVLNEEAPQPFFVWTERGNAQTRTHNGSKKDQSLFLRGFLMAASPAVWKARKKAFLLKEASARTSFTPGAPRSSVKNMGDKDVLDHQAADTNSQDERSFNSLSPSAEEMNGLSIHPIPPFATPAGDYPSFRINQALLDLTDADFAITHDDDWKEAIREVTAEKALGYAQHSGFVVAASLRLAKIFSRHIARVNCTALLIRSREQDYSTQAGSTWTAKSNSGYDCQLSKYSSSLTEGFAWERCFELHTSKYRRAALDCRCEYAVNANFKDEVQEGHVIVKLNIMGVILIELNNHFRLALIQSIVDVVAYTILMGGNVMRDRLSLETAADEAGLSLRRESELARRA
ncbi:hypothetical protein BKA70DRAFT_1408771 [Coprinopsis sp. MPI-PUGE-AT-0042]|nr:hypothetical protein BKA70DRAFT_1408771 [Coprinopsis sp. MPI-PUGE-AT-0042]